MQLTNKTDFKERVKGGSIISEEELRDRAAIWMEENRKDIVRCNHLSAWFHKKHCMFIKDPNFNNGLLIRTCGDCEVAK
jgi:hypothetical protein